MARPLRLEFAGAVYHVTSRGDRREDIYHSDEDRLVWLNVFAEVCHRYRWRCHAYCLMDNHYHIVVETLKGNLSKGMRQINGVYTQRFNQTHNRVGHVYQGRYKAILVEKDAYLLELSRYVVLNPVRSRRVKQVGRWPWSSYAMMLGKQAPPEWLETEWLLRQFSKQRKRAIAHYIDFVRAGIGLPSLWQDLRQQIYLGEEKFIKRMQRKAPTTGDLSEVPKVQRRPRARALEYYGNRYKNRNRAISIAFQSGSYTMKQIADYFGIHYSTVSRAIRDYEQDRAN